MSLLTGKCRTGHTVKPHCTKCGEYVPQCPTCDEKYIEIQEWRTALREELYEKLAALADAHARGEHNALRHVPLYELYTKPHRYVPHQGYRREDAANR